MTKKTTLFNVCFFLFTLSGMAQQNYVSTKSKGVYQDLVNPTLINGKDSIQEAYYVNANFQFPAFGAFANFKLNSSIPSLGAYVTRAGYLAVYESPGYQYTDVFHGYYNPGLVRLNSTSSMSVLLTGNTGNQILKFQWKNMGLINHSGTEYVNFQIWFNEADKTVSYHYGPSTAKYDTTDIGVISMFRAPNSFSSLTHSTNLGGDAAIPDSFIVTNPKKFNELNGVYNFPPNGTIITFKQPTGGISINSKSELFKIYPNPSKGVFNVNIENPKGKLIVEVYNSIGLKILEVDDSNNLLSLDISNQPNGLYFVKAIRDDNVIEIQKLIKQ